MEPMWAISGHVTPAGAETITWNGTGNKTPLNTDRIGPPGNSATYTKKQKTTAGACGTQKLKYFFADQSKKNEKQHKN